MFLAKEPVITQSIRSRSCVYGSRFNSFKWESFIQFKETMNYANRNEDR